MMIHDNYWFINHAKAAPTMTGSRADFASLARRPILPAS
jgi:hypothetical protein